MTPCNGNHSINAPCDDPECPKSKVIDMPSEEQAAEPSRDSLMITICIVLGRLVGLLIRFLDTCQTVLMHTAWRNGWRPGSKEAVKALRVRVLGMEVKREMRRKLQAERELEHETKRVTKRFSKSYGP